jgi:uncharacterized phage protein gp47/JayE
MSGLSIAGFELKTLSECLDDIVAGLLVDVDSELDTSTDQPIGQIAGTFAKPNAEVWEILGQAMSGWDDKNATGSLLDAVCAITGTRRIPQRKSVVAMDCTLNIGTALTTTAMVQVLGDPTRQFTLRAPFTAPSTGVHSLVFEAVFYGPIEALAGTVTTIVTPVTGWTVATNPDDADPGATTEKDSTLRIRRRKELRAQGASTLPALEAALNPADIPGLISATVLENDTMATVGGLPAKSFEAIIWDGATPAADDETIRKTIWKHKPLGIQSVGDNVGTFVDAKGVTRTVPFSRAVQRRIIISMIVQRDASLFPSDGATQIKQAIADDGLLYGSGQDVIRLRVQKLALPIAGVIDVPSCLLNIYSLTSPAEANVTIDELDIATFNTADITITLTP